VVVCFQSFQIVLKAIMVSDVFVLNVNPGTNADFAKLLAWSFVAGFSEKFVPNLIAKLEGQSRAYAKRQSIS